MWRRIDIPFFRHGGERHHPTTGHSHQPRRCGCDSTAIEPATQVGADHVFCAAEPASNRSIEQLAERICVIARSAARVSADEPARTSATRGHLPSR